MNKFIEKTYEVENIELMFAGGKPSVIKTTKNGASVSEGTKDYSDVYGSHYYISLGGLEDDYVSNNLFAINSVSCKRVEFELEGVTLTGNLNFMWGFEGGTHQVLMGMKCPVNYDTGGIYLHNQNGDASHRTQIKLFDSTQPVIYTDINMGVILDNENKKSIAHFDYSYVENSENFPTLHDMNLNFRAFLIGNGNVGSVKIKRIKIKVYS